MNVDDMRMQEDDDDEMYGRDDGRDGRRRRGRDGDDHSNAQRGRGGAVEVQDDEPALDGYARYVAGIMHRTLGFVFVFSCNVYNFVNPG